MMKIKAHKIALAIALATGMSGSACAGTASGADTKTADLAFVAPSALSHELDPVEGLVEGEIRLNTNLARGIVLVLDGAPAFIGVRPLQSTVVSWADENGWRIAGQNTGKLMRVYMPQAGNMNKPSPAFRDGGWRYTNPATQLIYQIRKNATEYVYADNYIVGIEAAIYEP